MDDMYGTILIPTDGSEAATAAVSAVVPLAERFGASIRALNVIDLSQVTPALRDEAETELTDHAEAVTAEVVDAADSAGIDAVADWVSTTEPVHRAIIEYATGFGVDLIAMGTTAGDGLKRMALGSTARRTLRYAPQPVLTVSADATRGGELDTILHPTDGSDGAVAAADHAIELAAGFEAGLHVINVVDVSGPWATLESSDLLVAFEAAGRDAVDAVIDRAENREILSVQATVLNGTPASVITDYATDRDVDLIVMGTHGRTGLERVLLGSVAERVVGTANVPVLAVKPPGATD